MNLTSFPAGRRPFLEGAPNSGGADDPVATGAIPVAPDPVAPARDPSPVSCADVPWRFTTFLAFGSAWAAAQLWFWPDQFPLGHTPMTLSDGIRGQERVWSIVCLATALLMASGLACRLWTGMRVISATLTITGLFLTIIIWTIVGVSWTLDFPHSLAPVMLIGGSLGAAWQLMQWKSPRSRTRR